MLTPRIRFNEFSNGRWAIRLWGEVVETYGSAQAAAAFMQTPRFIMRAGFARQYLPQGWAHYINNAIHNNDDLFQRRVHDEASATYWERMVENNLVEEIEHFVNYCFIGALLESHRVAHDPAEVRVREQTGDWNPNVNHGLINWIWEQLRACSAWTIDYYGWNIGALPTVRHLQPRGYIAFEQIQAIFQRQFEPTATVTNAPAANTAAEDDDEDAALANDLERGLFVTRPRQHEPPQQIEEQPQLTDEQRAQQMTPAQRNQEWLERARVISELYRDPVNSLAIIGLPMQNPNFQIRARNLIRQLRLFGYAPPEGAIGSNWFEAAGLVSRRLANHDAQ